MKAALTLFLLVVSSVYSRSTPSSCSNIVTRQQWNAREGDFVDYIAFPVENVIIHHTVTPSCTTSSGCTSTVQSIQNYHIDNVDFGDIGYNFLIGGDGKVYEGVGWHKVGAHTYGYNSKSIGIGFIGTFTSIAPPNNQLQAAKDLLRCGVELGELSEDYKLYGAKQVSSTESPGIRLYDKIRQWPHFTKVNSII